MLGYYVIMVATLGMSVTAGMTILASASAGDRLAQAGRDAQALAQAEVALRQALAFDAEGAVYPPGGQTAAGDDYTALPDWVISQNLAPSSGMAFGYCPFAVRPAADAADLPQEKVLGRDGSEEYKVRVRDRAAKGGTPRKFVEQGARAPHNMDKPGAPDPVAFIIGPSRGQAAIADCAQVYWDGVAWQIDTTGGAPGGIVRAITREGVADAGAERAQVLRRTVAREGTGGGDRRDDPGLLARALGEWQAARPARMTIEFLREANPTATYDLTQAQLDLLGTSGGTGADQFGRSLQLEALAGSGVVRLRAVDGAGAALSAANMRAAADLVVRGIDFGVIELRVDPGVRVVLEDVVLPHLLNEGGDVILRGTSTIGTDTLLRPAIVSNGGSLNLTTGGELNVKSSNTAAGAIQLDGARLRVEGELNVSATAAAAFVPDLPFLASYGEGAAVIKGVVNVTDESGSRIPASELTGLTYSTLGSQICTALASNQICRKTAICKGVLVEGSCNNLTDIQHLQSMKTVRTGDGAYLECIWRRTATSGTIDGTASARCLPIRLDSGGGL